MRRAAARLRFASASLLFALAACENTPAATDTAAGVGVAFDTRATLDTGAALDIAAAPDIAAPLDLGGDAAAEVAVDVAKDAVGPDLPPACDEGGCPCSENAQCASGYCLDDAGTGACAFPCQPSCPIGTSCKTLKAGADDVQVCVPKFPRVCDPCNQDGDCQGGAAGTTALCIDYGDGKGASPGKFCGGACDDTTPCPTGYTCAQVKNAAGALVKQCKKTDGFCTCSPRAVKLGLGTSCSAANAFGTCNGKRFCDQKGLSPCGAAEPAAETCNGQDDNCDGKTDDDACDDKNVCTADSCDPIKKACVNTALTTSCDDGNFCTTKDACKNGVCQGQGKSCDDGNPCTDDGCDAKGACVNAATTGPCSDDSPCNVAGQCKDGACQGIKPKNCNDNNPCTADSCVDGKCVTKQIAAPCDDGNACTTADVCDGGICAGKAKPCSDNNPCTEDACDPGAAAGCKYTPAPAPCDDGNACTTKDFCAAGACAGSTASCNDGSPCTIDSCDPAKGCVNAAAAGSCDDGNPCTAGDLCQSGKCQAGGAAKCDDGNPCTTDTCDPSKGCVYAPNSDKCDDKDACTANDACVGGACKGGTNQCGCQSDANCAGQAGNPCSGKLYCDKTALPYKCVPDAKTAIVCNTSADTECKKTSCDPASGTCTAKPINESGLCSDGNACTTGDACQAGVCKPAGTKDCEDNNACTDDSCAPSGASAGCKHTFNTSPCNDGDACTKGDVCANGVCKGAGGAGCCVTNADCDDNNACTVDTCDAKSGACAHSAATTSGQACDADGNGCTADTCQAGTCAAGTPVSCAASADACNDATCKSSGPGAYTCAKVAKADGASCDDGLFCTAGEACLAGKCQGGKPKDCSSAGCTTGTCDEATKSCKGTAKPDGATCDADNNGCTKDDACKAGVCVGGAKVDCTNPTDPCNDWACTSTGAVTYQCKPTAKAKGAPCEDGKFCTEGDGCDGAGKCLAGSAKPCSEVANACNDASCDEVAGKCVPKPKADNTACNDGDSCTATDVCKAGLCQGQNNACGDFKVSTFKSDQASGWRAPAIVDLGGGRFRVAWPSTDSELSMRGFRADWSREHSENSISTGKNLTALQAIPSSASGGNDLVWGANFANQGSCTAYYSSSCVTSNGCLASAYDDCGCCQSCTRTRYTSNHELSWQRYDGVHTATAGKFNVVSAATTCSKSSPALGVGKMEAAAYTDARRLVAWGYPTAPQLKILAAAGTVVKDLGADPNAKNFDVAVHVDGTAIFVWDDGAEIWAQMYYNDGSTNGQKFQVNTKTSGAQTRPRVAFQPSGRYVVAWDTDQGGGDIAVQVFKPEPGSFLGAEQVANSTVTGIQANAQLAVYQDGSFGVVFEDSSGKDGGGYGILGQWFSSSGTKVGAERIVNATFGGDQRLPVAQGLSSDEGVVAWLNLADNHIYARKFDKAGNVQNGVKEFLVNATTAGEQAAPSVAVAGNGAFAIAWDSEGLDGAGTGIAVQRFAADGSKAGAETVVNSYKTDSQTTPSLGMDTAGNFVVIWDSFGQDGDIDGVFGQRFKGDGSKAGAEFAINQFKTNDQQKPVVAMQPDGSFAAVWESFGQTGGAKYDVVMRCYDANGAALGNEQIVNSTTAESQQAPHIAAFGDGRYLVVWESFGEDTSGWGVYGQLLYKDCKAIGGQFLVNTTKASDQRTPRGAADSNGAFVVVWKSAGQDGDNFGIYAQHYDKTGAKAGVEFKLNAVTAGEQAAPVAAFLPNGNLVAAWQTIGEDEAGLAVKSAQFKAAVQQSSDWMVNTTFAGDQNQPAIGGRFDGSWVMAWRSLGQDGAKGAVIARILK